jgi:small subunit ribosomal protein S20
MPNTNSASKRVRQNARKALVNKSRKSRVHSAVRRVEEAVKSGDKTAAANALKAAEPEIMRAAGKGAIHSRTASRKVSRLTNAVKKLEK